MLQGFEKGDYPPRPLRSAFLKVFVYVIGVCQSYSCKLTRSGLMGEMTTSRLPPLFPLRVPPPTCQGHFFQFGLAAAFAPKFSSRSPPCFFFISVSRSQKESLFPVMRSLCVDFTFFAFPELGKVPPQFPFRTSQPLIFFPFYFEYTPRFFGTFSSVFPLS